MLGWHWFPVRIAPTQGLCYNIYCPVCEKDSVNPKLLPLVTWVTLQKIFLSQTDSLAAEGPGLRLDQPSKLYSLQCRGRGWSL